MGNNILGPLSLLSGCLCCELNWWCVPINAVHSHWVPWGILYLFTQHLFSPKKTLQYKTFIFKSFFSFTYTGMHCSPLEKSAHEEFLLFARQPSPLVKLCVWSTKVSSFLGLSASTNGHYQGMFNYLFFQKRKLCFCLTILDVSAKILQGHIKNVITGVLSFHP